MLRSNPDDRSICLLAGDVVQIDAGGYNHNFAPPSKTERIEVQWESFFRIWGPVASMIPVHSCLGNHDAFLTYQTERDADLIEAFQRYFPYPYPEDACYWSFDYGPMHVAVLDQYTDLGPDSPQFAWLAADLRRAQQRPWTLVLVHEPVDAENSNEPDWRAGPDAHLYPHVWEQFVRFGVDLVVAGHMHRHSLTYIDGVPQLVMSIATGGTWVWNWHGSKAVYSMFYRFLIEGGKMTIDAILASGEIQFESEISSR